ncbi:MAG: DUF3094 family protein [Spongiibacteraceae bacterium]
MKENQLYPEDQARVDQYLREGYNDVERKPFRPLYMMALLTTVVTLFSILAVVIARVAGVY